MPKKKSRIRLCCFPSESSTSVEIAELPKSESSHNTNCGKCRKEKKKQRRRNFFKWWKKKNLDEVKCPGCAQEDNLDIQEVCNDDNVTANDVTATASQNIPDQQVAQEGSSLPTDVTTVSNIPETESSVDKEEVTTGSHTNTLAKKESSDKLDSVDPPDTSTCWNEPPYECECQLTEVVQDVKLCPPDLKPTVDIQELIPDTLETISEETSDSCTEREHIQTDKQAQPLAKPQTDVVDLTVNIKGSENSCDKKPVIGNSEASQEKQIVLLPAKAQLDAQKKEPAQSNDSDQTDRCGSKKSAFIKVRTIDTSCTPTPTEVALEVVPQNRVQSFVQEINAKNTEEIAAVEVKFKRRKEPAGEQINQGVQTWLPAEQATEEQVIPESDSSVEQASSVEPGASLESRSSAEQELAPELELEQGPAPNPGASVKPEPTKEARQSTEQEITPELGLVLEHGLLNEPGISDEQAPAEMFQLSPFPESLPARESSPSPRLVPNHVLELPAERRTAVEFWLSMDSGPSSFVKRTVRPNIKPDPPDINPLLDLGTPPGLEPSENPGSDSDLRPSVEPQSASDQGPSVDLGPSPELRPSEEPGPDSDLKTYAEPGAAPDIGPSTVPGSEPLVEPGPVPDLQPSVESLPAPDLVDVPIIGPSVELYPANEDISNKERPASDIEPSVKPEPDHELEPSAKMTVSAESKKTDEFETAVSPKPVVLPTKESISETKSWLATGDSSKTEAAAKDVIDKEPDTHFGEVFPRMQPAMTSWYHNIVGSAARNFEMQSFHLGVGIFQASTKFLRDKLRGTEEQKLAKEIKSVEKIPSGPSETVLGAAAAAAASFYETDMQYVENLVALGFTKSQATQALKVSDNDVEQAAEWLFSGSSIDSPCDQFRKPALGQKMASPRLAIYKAVDLIPKEIKEYYDKKKIPPITQEEYEKGIAEALLETEPDTTPVTSSSTINSSSKVYADMVEHVNSVGAFYSDYDNYYAPNATVTHLDGVKEKKKGTGPKVVHSENKLRDRNVNENKGGDVEKTVKEDEDDYKPQGITGCSVM